MHLFLHIPGLLGTLENLENLEISWILKNDLENLEISWDF